MSDGARAIPQATRPAAPRQGQPTSRQTNRTVGVAPLERPSVTARFFLAVVAAAERLNLRQSKVGNPEIYDNATFPWIAGVEHEWEKIRAELERILVRKDELPAFHELSADVRTITTDRDWKTFFLTGYGLRSKRNIALCPETWRIVQTIPGLKTAMFSILEPGKHLPAHRGPYNGVLRLHLGLLVPEPRGLAAIRVGQQIHHWQEGEAVVFDDAYEHEAWNRTAGVRVVLFVDFVKPLRFPANLLNWLIINLAAFTPFVREGTDNHKRWEARFHLEG